MRPLLSQAANAAVKAKESVLEMLYRRLVTQLGHHKAIWAVAHRLCRVICKVLPDVLAMKNGDYQTNPQAVQRRAARLVRQLRRLGYGVQLNAQLQECRHNARGFSMVPPPLPAASGGAGGLCRRRGLGTLARIKP
jgi:hypothetical protein